MGKLCLFILFFIGIPNAHSTILSWYLVVQTFSSQNCKIYTLNSDFLNAIAILYFGILTFFTQLQVYIPQFWFILSEMWDINSQMQVINSNSEDCPPEGDTIQNHIRQTILSSYATRQANASWLNHKSVPQNPNPSRWRNSLDGLSCLFRV